MEVLRTTMHTEFLPQLQLVLRIWAKTDLRRSVLKTTRNEAPSK